MARIRTLNFLPDVFQTSTNSQFLSATLDQIVNDPVTVKVQGYIGNKFGPGARITDFYVNEPTKERTNYQLEPGVVFTKPEEKTAKDFITYPEMISAINLAGGITNNHNRLFNSEIYSWDSFTDLDKLVNYHEYYWLQDGPPAVTVSPNTIFTNSDFNVFSEPNSYRIEATGTDIDTGSNPVISLLRGGTYNFIVDQDTQFFIQTKPGTSGFRRTQPFISSREVFGVENNGATQGIVTFNVPFADAQDDFIFDDTINIDLVSNLTFDQVNGRNLNNITDPQTGEIYPGLVDIDGVTGIDGLRIIFFNSLPGEIGYISSYYDEMFYDMNDDSITSPRTIVANQTTSNSIILAPGNSTTSLIPNQTITIVTDPMGGLEQGQVYFVKDILSASEFTIAETLGGDTVSIVPQTTGTMTLNINQGQYEQGFYTNVSENFYRVQLIGDPANPVIRLLPDGTIPQRTNLVPRFGTEFINRQFFRNDLGIISLVPIITAPLSTLYYADGTNPNRVGVIKLIETSGRNFINVEEEILGQPTYTSPNGVQFTNGLKVTFDGNIFPASYRGNTYYVENVGTAIELVDTRQFLTPEPFTVGEFSPFDTVGYDLDSFDIDLDLPIEQDYITVARNSISRDAWARSNRWFHGDVIRLTAEYNRNSNILNDLLVLQNKAKRPIIEFKPNLKLFNSGIEGKDLIDFFDTRALDALSDVAGLVNYFPDTKVYTDNTALINSTPNTIVNIADVVKGTTYLVENNSGTSQDVWNTLAGTEGIFYLNGDRLVAAFDGGDLVSPGTGTLKQLYNTVTITVPTTAITGTFEVGMFVGDTKDILPNDAQIIDITEAGNNVELTVLFSFPQEISSDTTSLAASDIQVTSQNLFSGARIVFANDQDSQTRGEIYVVDRVISFGNTKPVITLAKASDGDVLPGQQVTVKRGTNGQGKTYYYDGLDWTLAQQKVTVNQAPLFDLFDSNNTSFGDSNIYNGTSFTGSTLFSYGINSAGVNDPILGFPIRFSDINNAGDISFDVTINSGTFEYSVNGQAMTESTKTGYVHQFNSLDDYKRLIGWTPASDVSSQYLQFDFSYTPSNVYVLDVAPVEQESTNWPVLKVFVNSEYLTEDKFVVSYTNNTTTVNILEEAEENSTIQVFVLSEQISDNGYYAIPDNLANNPFNEDLDTVDLGDIRNHYRDIFINAPNITGNVFGINNYRDLGDLAKYGTKIIKNSASLALPGLFLRNQELNINNALMFSSREYTKYKQLLVNLANESNFFDEPTNLILDRLIEEVAANRSEINSFFWSDMVPNKTVFSENTYLFNSDVDITRYPLHKVYDFTKASYDGLLVYLRRIVGGRIREIQLLKDIDYIIDAESPSLTVTKDLTPGDNIIIKEYNQTFGSYAPYTPSKLGLYPLFVPEVVLDNNYSTPTYFIKGHDGSYTKLYGDYDPDLDDLTDLRDRILLEFEKRVYNNAKLPKQVFNVYDFVPGFFRETDFSYEEWLELYSENFLDWIGQNRIEYKRQFYNLNNEFTYNYVNATDKISNSQIKQGNFRGIYSYFYDTFTPNLTPWEMLGFSNKPSWWEDRYGPAPYTSDNLLLWADIEEGKVYDESGEFVINEKLARPGLSSIIPVDENGNLKSPLQTVVSNYNTIGFQRDWKVGDVGPAELAYRRSSAYPFDLVKIFSLSKPAMFYNLAVDVDEYKFNEEFNQYLVNDRTHLDIGSIKVYGDGVAKTSYLNWIVDYAKQFGVAVTSQVLEAMNNLDVRLVYRLAGFSDQTLLNFFVEKSSPSSQNSSLLIPEDSLSILLHDNQAFDKLVYSSVIIQKLSTGGYSVFGNSQTNAFFTVFRPVLNNNTRTVEVIDQRVTLAKDYTRQEITVPYGTVFGSVQELSQFLMNYDAYLRDKGVTYNQVVDGNEVDWLLMVKQFMYWTQLGWDAGSIITLNPLATEMTIDKEGNIVQPLTLSQQNFILNQDLYPIQVNNLCINRDGAMFKAHTLNEGDSMAFATFNISNIEHGAVFDNTTLFGDVIYNLVTGLRQSRMLVKGTKTANWNGTINSWGFILSQDNINEWSNDTKYPKGVIVKYKNNYYSANQLIQPAANFDETQWTQISERNIQLGLLPNSATRAFESTLYYNTQKSNLDVDADLLSYSLIGYRPRDYMTLANLSGITEINVYKNMIKSKGTVKSLKEFDGVNLIQGNINYELYENWAIKTGEYGGRENDNFIEFSLDNEVLTNNPSIVSLTDGVYTPGSNQEVTLTSLLNYKSPIDNPNILSVVDRVKSTVFPYAGYANFNDVKMSSFFYAGLRNAVNKENVRVPITDFYVRDYLWLANFKEQWGIFTWKPLGAVVEVTPNVDNTSTITFDVPHNLKALDPIAIVNFSNNVDGYYIVSRVVNLTQVVINLSISVNNNRVLTSNGVGLLITSQRVKTPSEISNLDLLEAEFTKNTVWVDENTDGNWAVYRKTNNYENKNTATEDNTIEYGKSVAFNGNVGYLVSDPANGTVYRYSKNTISGEYEQTQVLTSNASFGDAIAQVDNVFAISEPDTPAVYLYGWNQTVATDDLFLYQTINLGTVGSGAALEFSQDGNWLFVNNPEDVTVNVYRKANVEILAPFIQAGRTYIIDEVGDTDFLTIGADENKKGMIFQATGAGVGTGKVTDITFELVSVVDGGSIDGFVTSDTFGKSIASDFLAETLAISAPNVDFSLEISDWGKTLVYQRATQTFEVQNNSTTDRVQEYKLGFTVGSEIATVVSTNSVGNIVTVSDASQFVLGAPIVFRGNGLLDTNITPNVTYYINTIAGNNITLKTSRNTNTVVTLATKGSITGVNAVCQTEKLLVSVNGTVVQDNNYATVGDIFIYSGQLTAGDVLRVDGNEFFNIQTLTSNSIERPNHQFGFAIDMNNSGSELLVGSPFEVDSENREGQVYRYSNTGAKYGLVVGTSECNITTNREIYINGYQVLLRPGNAETNADIINSFRITNIMASYTSDNRLIIQVINKDLAQINRKLVVTSFDKDALSEAGIELLVETQVITAPHNVGPTQFGSAIKFNERNSVVIGAPAASKVLGTTFDFSDNEDLDDDTVFDNNATRFVESFADYGTAYMYDLLDDFNGSIDNPGKFVYAQPINNSSIDYTLSPRYGSAIDFSDNVVIVSAPRLQNSVNSTGSVDFFQNEQGVENWSVYRAPVETVDIEKIQNAQIFSSVTNNTLINLDYIDPLQGKILGAARENIDFISNVDPASYNTNTGLQKTWGEEEVGSIWLDTTNIRFVDYRQDDIVYNSEYWGQVFPGSDTRVFTWVRSNTPPNQYKGPGTVYDVNKFAVSNTLNSSNVVTPVYYFWVRDTGTINIDRNKKLADTTIASYIQNPKNAGIAYMAPLLPNTFALYNAETEINSAGAALHVGYALSDTLDFIHNEFALIRENNEADFLTGLPGVRNRPATLPNRIALPGPGEVDEPTGLYLKLLDSLSGTNPSGQIIPDPFLPPLFQTGILNRPRQSFFLDRLTALKNYLSYANDILKSFPIVEIRPDLSFLFLSNEFYDTTDYWEYINWWAPGYDESTRASLQVARFADLFSLTVAPETLVKVEQNGQGFFEIYKLERSGAWSRIGLEKGTIKFSEKLWNYFDNNIGFSIDFFDILPYDTYPTEETRNIIRALNEQIYTDELAIHKNKSLILLFEYIVSEANERQNNLSWLNKTSLVEVEQKVRELLPFEILKSDNEEFLEGYIEEVKPYHVTIKEFLLSYDGSENFVGDISDFDLPAKFNADVGRFVTPNLVNGPGNDRTDFGYDSDIWNDFDYTNWFNNNGLTITGIDNFNIATLRSFVDVASRTMTVDNSSGFPTTGVIRLGEEIISYSNVNRDTNELLGLSRGLFNTSITEHSPGESIIIDLPPVIVLDEGSGYTEIPRVTAYIDTSIYPAPRVEAELQAVLSGNRITAITVINPGEGYMVRPEIIVEPAYTITFSDIDINSDLNTINVFAPDLRTGDIVKFKQGSNGGKPTKLVDNEWYYVGVLETLPSVVIALYNTVSEAVRDENRIELQAVTPSSDMQLLPGCRASVITTAAPVRGNNIKLRLDRTSYTSQVKDWEAQSFYGGFFAGDFYNSDRVSSSAITLQSTVPDINDIFVSAAGIVFEIENVDEEVVLTYSSFPRIISKTNALDNTIELVPQDGNNPDLSELANNASGTTIGFYKNMPIKFSGAGPVEIVENQTYYVSRIFDDLRFTISATVDGPEVSLNDFTVSAQGYRCFTGENNSTTILTLKYPDIHQVTRTEAGTNRLTVPVTEVGSGGTFGFYTNLPVFFTENAFGDVVENLVYYVTTVIDNETFTMSETTDPVMTTAIQTDDASNTVILDSVEGFSKNDPIIFTNIDGLDSNIVAGKTYYIGEVLSGNRISIADFLNGPTILLGNSTGTALVTNQKDTVVLSNGTGSMTMNVQLPVSPGQIDGQLFTFYNSSGTRPGIVSENYSDLIVRSNIITVGTNFGEAVNRIFLPVRDERGASNFYVNLPVTVSTTAGGLTAGTTYYVVEYSGMDDPNNPGTAIPDTTVEVVSSSDVNNALTAVYDVPNNKLGTAVLYPDMPLRFSGAGLGNIDVTVEYFVKDILSITEFTISLTPGGPEFDLSTANGNLIGTGDPYVVVSATKGGLPLSLTNSGPPSSTKLEQVILQAPVFNVSNIAGGYVAQIADGGEGFAINNVITISGTETGGVTPDNDLRLVVNTIDEDGAITSVIREGTPPGTVEQYYLKVRSPNQVEVYKNSILTVPVSKSEFNYDGYVSTLVNGSTSDTLTLDTSRYSNFDPVVFTGDNAPTAITAGRTYYLFNITPTTAQITTLPNNPATLVTGITFVAEFTMAKLGSVTILPEPFFFTQSIVRFNNRLYVCAISNNDKEFVIGKWELLDSGDRRLNAMDRVFGYYQPTDNMPAANLSQLFDGVTYPNPVYRANEFEPDKQFELDTVLTTVPFVQVDIDIKGIVYSNNEYNVIAALENGTGVFTSTDLSNWSLKRLTNADIELTGIFNLNGTKLITSTNSITPVFKSDDGEEWTSTGYYLPGTGIPLAIDISAIKLNAAAYYSAEDLYVMVGENIVTSRDKFVWTDRTNFNPVLSYMLNDVVATDDFVIAVGKGKTLSQSLDLEDTGLIFYSTDGVTWQQISVPTANGFTSVSFDGTKLIAVGEQETIFTSVDGINWRGVNDVSVVFADSIDNIINVDNALGFSMDTPVVFNNNFSTIVSGTTYYVAEIISDTQVKISDTQGGPVKVITSATIPQNTRMSIVNNSSVTLNKVIFAGNTWIAIGNNGIAKISSDGNIWTRTQINGLTINLIDITFNEDSNEFIAVGDTNTILVSNSNTPSWDETSIVNATQTTYTIRGTDFNFGYAPEELVAGVVKDNLSIIPVTRPGNNWPVPEYGHSGFNANTVILEAEFGTQTVYSFDNVVQVPAKVTVQVIDGSTGLAYTIYEGISYEIDWVEKTIILNEPLRQLPVEDKLMISVYEVGNGYQIVKSSTDILPIRTNEFSGFNEIYLNCNYSAEIFEGSGAIQPGTSSLNVRVFRTESLAGRIFCDSVDDFILSSPITFQGQPFGGLEENTVYYVSSISKATNSITVSDVIDPNTGLPGLIITLTDATGQMFANIESGTGDQWSPALVLHNGTRLVPGGTGFITESVAVDNSLVTSNTGNLTIGMPITFCQCEFGVLESFRTYYVRDILSGRRFTVSETPSGDIVSQIDFVGLATYVTNDFAIGRLENNQASLLLARNDYTIEDDYIVFSVFGEELFEQRGHSLPETEVFIGDGLTSKFFLTNFAGAANPENAIVELNGIRLTSALYEISDLDNSILLDSPPLSGDVLAVTTFNDTLTQYLNTQFNVTGNPDSSLLNLVVVQTINKIGTFDQDIPVVQTFDQDTPEVVTYDEFLNYLVLGTGTTADININDSVIFSSPTIGGLIARRTYYVKEIIDSVTFTVSEEVGGDTTVVFDDTGTMTTLANGLTVSEIVNVDGNITSPFAVTNATDSTVGAPNEITVADLAGFVVGQPVQFFGTSFDANIDTDGTVYFINSINTGNSSFTIIDFDGNPVTTAGGTGLMQVVVGDRPTVRVTTDLPHGFLENTLVRIDGVGGSTQINNNLYYAKIINSTQFDIYEQPYDPAIGGSNFPVTVITAYTGGGFVWRQGLFFLQSNSVTETTVSGEIFVDRVDNLVPNTPVYFSKVETANGETLLGGLIQGKEYFIVDIDDISNFITVSETRGGPTLTFTNDDSETINLMQWKHDDVDRIYVTINGNRVPSDKLKLNDVNEVSILAKTVPGDQVIITSMIPTATPNQLLYINMVDSNGTPSVFRFVQSNTSWLAQDLSFADEIMVVSDVSKLVTTKRTLAQTPATEDGVYKVGINAERNSIVSITVNNVTTGAIIPESAYTLVIDSLTPTLRITPGSYILQDDELVIDVLEGSPIYANGEIIRFTSVDFANNTLSGLSRGINGTARQTIIPEFTNIYSLSSQNRLPEEDYSKVWNTNFYNEELGDPLQLSASQTADFLKDSNT